MREAGPFLRRLPCLAFLAGKTSLVGLAGAATFPVYAPRTLAVVGKGCRRRGAYLGLHHAAAEAAPQTQGVAYTHYAPRLGPRDRGGSETFLRPPRPLWLQAGVRVRGSKEGSHLNKLTHMGGGGGLWPGCGQDGCGARLLQMELEASFVFGQCTHQRRRRCVQWMTRVMRDGLRRRCTAPSPNKQRVVIRRPRVPLLGCPWACVVYPSPETLSKPL